MTRRTSETAALAAVAAGEGIMLAPSHAVAEQVRRRALVVLDVRGTPLLDLWHASTLAPDRCLPAASELQRFATTPEAMQAMFSGPGWVPAARFRPPVHVTLWRSVARGIDGGAGGTRGGDARRSGAAGKVAGGQGSGTLPGGGT